LGEVMRGKADRTAFGERWQVEFLGPPVKKAVP
jgi:hypothetical protein